jgi:hypothetical protein
MEDRWRGAAEHDNVQELQSMHTSGLPIDQPIMGACAMDSTALCFAIGLHGMSGGNSAMRFLLDHGANPNLLLGFCTPVHEAARYGDYADLKVLFEYGGDPRVVNMNERTVQWVLKHEIADREATIAEQEGVEEEGGWNWELNKAEQELYGFQECLRLVRAWTSDRLRVPAWTTTTHRKYGSGFKRAMKTWLLVGNRIGLPLEMSLEVAIRLGKEEQRRRGWMCPYRHAEEVYVKPDNEDCTIM